MSKSGANQPDSLDVSLPGDGDGFLFSIEFFSILDDEFFLSLLRVSADFEDPDSETNIKKYHEQIYATVSVNHM